MLKTTILKIRKVCAIACLPRALRATGSSSEKFEKLSFVAVYKTQLRCKSDNHGHNDCNQPKRVIRFTLTKKSPRKSKRDNFENIQDKKCIVIDRQHELFTNSVKSESECEKCQKLIAKVFEIEDKSEKHEVESNRLDEIRLQTRTIDKHETEYSHERKKAARGEMPENTYMPSKILGNIAQVNLADSKDCDYSEKRINKDPEIQSSEVFDDAAKEKHKDNKVKATTFKEDEDHLTQKMERLSETPVVQTHTKVEGFNVTPQVLEENAKWKTSNENSKCLSVAPRVLSQNATLNYSPQNTNQDNKLEPVGTLKNTEYFDVTPHSLDQNAHLSYSSLKLTQNPSNLTPEQVEEAQLDKLANRCINSPDNEIDEQLLNEMENLKTPYSNQISSNPINRTDFEKINIINEDGNVIKQSDTNYLKHEEIKNNANVNVLNRLYPTFDGPLYESDTQYNNTNSGALLQPERILLERKQLNFSETPKNLELINLEKNERVETSPNQVLIGPYDKNKLANEKLSDDSNILEDMCVNDESIYDKKEAIQGNQKKENEIADDEPRKDQLDPKYVVTCNETCPISADGLTTISIDTTKSALKGTEVIYDNITAANLNNHLLNEVTIKEKKSNYKHELEGKQLKTEQIVEAEELTGRTEKVESTINADHTTERAFEKEVDKNEEAGELTIERKNYKEPIHASYPQLRGIETKVVETTGLKNESNENESNKHCSFGIETQPMQSKLASTCACPLQKLNDEQLPLSELLRRVRERNKIEYCKETDFRSTAVEQISTQAAVIEPAIGKCGKKSPPCPPPAPKCPPPDPCAPKPCPPPEPACPKPCKPKCPPTKPVCPSKKNPCANFKKCFGFSMPYAIPIFWRPQVNCRLPVSLTAFDINKEVTEDILTNVSMKAVLTEEIVLKLEAIGKVLRYTLDRDHYKDIYNYFQNTTQRKQFVMKDFEPWTPIPSWPIPKKQLKRPLVCPKEGCKEIPTPKENPPCQLNPCKNFPKRTFSLADVLKNGVFQRSTLYQLDEL